MWSSVVSNQNICHYVSLNFEVSFFGFWVFFKWINGKGYNIIIFNSHFHVVRCWFILFYESMKGRVGRHQSNLLKFIINDLNKKNLPLNDINDLYELRATASNRVLWRQLFSSWRLYNFLFLFQKVVMFYGHLSVS